MAGRAPELVWKYPHPRWGWGKLYSGQGFSEKLSYLNSSWLVWGMEATVTRAGPEGV